MTAFWYKKNNGEFINAGFHHGTWLQENEALPDDHPDKVNLGIPEELSKEIVEYSGDPHDIRENGLNYGLARVDIGNRDNSVAFETKGLTENQLWDLLIFADDYCGPYSNVRIHDIANNNFQSFRYNDFKEEMKDDPAKILRPSRIIAFNLNKFKKQSERWNYRWKT